MKVQTMSRILLSVLIFAMMSLAFLFFADAMRTMGWLVILGGVALLVAVWVPWQKLGKGKSGK